MFWHVYVLQGKKDGRWYTGLTNTLRKRSRQHAEGLSTATKHRGSFVLIYYETCINEDDARSRETHLKSGMGKQYVHNRLKRSLSLTG